MVLVGSKKRRAIIKEYKEGRRPTRLNRNFEFEYDDVEKNKAVQRARILDYISDLPIHQITLPEIEADDVVAYLCQYYADERKVIVSSDRDFIQLLNEKTIIYNARKKILVTSVDAYKEYSIHPRNFVLARAVTGDKGDNLKGVKGIGLPRLLKMFPFFAEKEKISIEFFFEFCEKGGEKYKKFLDNKQVVIDNLKVMRLDTPIISFINVDEIQTIVTQPVKLNATAFRVKLLDDGMVKISDNYLQDFRILEQHRGNN
jgi:5'-3' exonuclease